MKRDNDETKGVYVVKMSRYDAKDSKNSAEIEGETKQEPSNQIWSKPRNYLLRKEPVNAMSNYYDPKDSRSAGTLRGSGIREGQSNEIWSKDGNYPLRKESDNVMSNYYDPKDSRSAGTGRGSGIREGQSNEIWSKDGNYPLRMESDNVMSNYYDPKDSRSAGTGRESGIRGGQSNEIWSKDGNYPLRKESDNVSEKGFLSWLDILVGKMVTETFTNTGCLNIMCQNPYNAVVVTGHPNGSVRMWSPNLDKPLARILCYPRPVTSIAIDNTGLYMAVAFADRAMKIFYVRTFKSLQTYKLGGAAGFLDFSQQGLLGVGFGNVVEVYKDCCTQSVKAPYMRHQTTSTVSGGQFCPYEDVLGIGYSKGFNSILIPGAGQPNFDAYESNPFMTKKQRREMEVKSLLEKIQPDLITLNPGQLASVDVSKMEGKRQEKAMFYVMSRDYVGKDFKSDLKNSKRSAEIEKEIIWNHNKRNWLQHKHKWFKINSEDNFDKDNNFDPFEGAAEVPEEVLKKYQRGEELDVSRARSTPGKVILIQTQKQIQQSVQLAARSELLLQEEAGFLQPDDDEDTFTVEQEEIVAAADITSASKYFDLSLTDFGPYKINYSRDGRHLLLGGYLGHVAAMDWVTKRLHCEINVMQSVHDLCWLHVPTMFATARNIGYTYMTIKGSNCIVSRNLIKFYSWSFCLITSY